MVSAQIVVEGNLSVTQRIKVLRMRTFYLCVNAVCH